MIIFHQGLPRSGKSYEAVVKQIFAALAAGRPVDAYVEGLEHAKIAEVLELPLERVLQLLQQLTREQAREWFKHARPNALIVLDEAQNLWPTQRLPLPEAMMTAIAEHGHHGQDILLMGQVFTDVHKFWRGRTSQRNTYIKLDAVGQENRYSVQVEKATAPEKFNTISKGFGSYDPKYFGTYKSHVDETINTANFKDPRANVKNAFWVRWGLPLTAGLGVWGAWVAWHWFHQTPTLPAAKPVAAAASAPASSATASAAKPGPKVRRPFLEELNERYRPRLAMLYQQGTQQHGVIEWWDGDKVRERLTFAEVQILGGRVEVRGTVARVGDTWITQWPVERAAQPAMVGAQVVPLSSVASLASQ